MMTDPYRFVTVHARESGRFRFLAPGFVDDASLTAFRFFYVAVWTSSAILSVLAFQRSIRRHGMLHTLGGAASEAGFLAPGLGT